MKDRTYVIIAVVLLIASFLMTLFSYTVLTDPNTGISITWKVIFIVIDVVLWLSLWYMAYKVK